MLKNIVLDGHHGVTGVISSSHQSLLNLVRKMEEKG